MPLSHDALFKVAFHNSPAVQTIIRFADMVIMEVNERFTKVLGFQREEVIGKTPFELNFWVSTDKLTTYRTLLQSQGAVRDFEMQVRAKDGGVRTVLLSSDLVEIDGVPHSITAGVDLTARKEAEAKLVESERRLRETENRLSTAFRASPVVMTIAPLDGGRFVEVNPAFVRLSGWKREEIIGRSSIELNLWVRTEERARFFERLQRDRVVRNFETELRHRQGTVRTFQLSGEVIELNREPHVITFGLDVTDRKRAEIELQNALSQERELNQLKSDFVSLVSHEFRTPLEIILSSTDNLQRYHDRLAAEKREQLLSTIHKSVRRMARMMEEVLVLGRLESDRMVYQPAIFDLRSFCQRVCDEIESATGRHASIRLSIQREAYEALGDENLLRHIFTNLLSNAVKYSPPDRTIHFKIERVGDQGKCQVVDEGCGIPEADQKRLFQAFHRGSNVRQVPGTGLGLLIVRRCVDLHQGEIEFRSVENEGTTFTVTLPLFGVKETSDPEI